MAIKPIVECTELIGTSYCFPFLNVVGLFTTANKHKHSQVSHRSILFFILLHVKLFSDFVILLFRLLSRASLVSAHVSVLPYHI